jgi:ubiquinone/menaquinone biosynthesis C-methylase UbiE
MVRALRLPTGVRVLEVGCGRGVALAPIARLCRPRLHAAIDLEPALIDAARMNASHAGVEVRVDVADIRRLPFGDGSFDVIIDFGTCYHVDRQESALKEIERVLAVGGLFVHETPLSQLLAHPIRTRGRALPFTAAPSLRPEKWAGLWATRQKQVVL